MPIIRLKNGTAERINEVFEKYIAGDSEVVRDLVKFATWDYKLNKILDRYEYLEEKEMEK